MAQGLETLEHQSAPESTRGLFDTCYDRKTMAFQSSRSTDRHRSSDSPGRAIPSRQSFSHQLPAAKNDDKPQQRLRSVSVADMGSFGRRKSHQALHTLTEEEGQQGNKINNNNSKPMSHFGTGGRRSSVTMDSLKDMINSMKSIPPTTSTSTSALSSSGNLNSGGGRKYGHRKQQSLSSLPFGQQEQQQQTSTQQSNIRRSYNDGKTTSDMHSVLESTIQELRSISSSSTLSDKRPMVSPRPSFFSSTYRRFSKNGGHMFGGDDTLKGQDAALAEAGAKLVGTAATGTGTITRPFFSGRRHSSDPSTTGGDGASFILNRRPSLQQLATLSEETPGPLTDRITTSRSSFSTLSKRTQFNKSLDIYSDNNNNKNQYSTRRSSRNVDSNWRSSALIQPTSPRQSFQPVPFTPTKVNFGRDDANSHQRRPLFIAHLPLSALTILFQDRQLVRGMLRVNKRNRSDAFVYCEELDADIYIAGSRDRNRALEGDVVAVRLIDVDKVLQEKREKEQVKSMRNAGQTGTRLPDEDDENEIIFGGDDQVHLVKPKLCGVVVAIMERAQNQVYSGTLTLMRPNNKRAQEETVSHRYKKDTPKIVWFKATDKRVPLIAIPTHQTPDDFVKDSQKYSTTLFVASIKRWPISSLHPFGTLEKTLGSVFDLSTQTKAIYADNNITDTDFSEAVYNCLPPSDFEASVEGTTTPTVNPRRDFTKVRCFTIDPKDSNVLDDAFSIEKLGEDSYQVGVHVSDVTYFIKPHSSLDKEARTRGVRVDLIHFHVPMVPETLTDKITNLIPNHNRFTFSVVWNINSQGKVLDTWYGKSIIRSSAQLTIDDAYTVIQGGSLDSKCVAEPIRQDIENDIRLLATITDEMHYRRNQSGCLTQRRDELSFEFESDHSPIGVSVLTKHISSHRMVKELLLLANTSVAQKISSRLPEEALLRRHSSPVDRKIRALQHYCARHLGVQVDIGSAGNLEKSIRAIKDRNLRKLVSVIVLNTLKTPKYFCAGTHDIAKYSHYALNVPLFTHFTSPSRRFADILVHRQLEYALSADSQDTPFYLDRDSVQKLAQYCNVKKEAAMNAREQSSLLFLGTYLNKLASQSVVYREATVVAVDEEHIDVMVGELNMEKRVHLANLPVWRSDFDDTKQTLTMYWRKGVDTYTGKQHFLLDDDDDDGDSQDNYLDEEIMLDEMMHVPPTQSLDNSLLDESYHPYQQETDGNGKKNIMGSSVLEHHAEKTISAGGVSATKKTGANDTIHNNLIASTSPSPSSPKSLQQQQPEPTCGKRTSLERARLSDSTGYSIEQGYQTIKALDKIQVALIVDMARTPPLIRILAVNPFA
ncbi:hypothetical protein BC941DRAFT_384356 [Chlamydoabsidia padenii]|nr:hypothetical protein BC941DRAFT_384356 [Chlamydoabsidia padenii]